MLVRRETDADLDAVRSVHTAAFADPERPDRIPPEVGLVDALRSSDAWLPAFSLVATGERDVVIGHVVCTRGHIGSVAALGLGPVGVRPDLQRRGVGSALMHAVLGAADALDEPLVALLGHVDYYPRFGFREATEYGIIPPESEWGSHFQVRTLHAHTSAIRGEFAYAQPFRDL